MPTVTLETINKNIIGLKHELEELKTRLNEEYELSEQAKKDLEEARSTMHKTFISHDKIMAKFG